LSEGFENVKGQIGFCGIWCGSCLGGNGAVQELTRKYEQTIKRSQYALERWCPNEFSFNEFMNSLACVEAMSLCPGCKKGGGNPACEIRTCASKRNMINCSQCNELSGCKRIDSMKQNYPRMKDDLRRIRDVDQKELIPKWTSELKDKWPHCTLLCKSTEEK